MKKGLFIIAAVFITIPTAVTIFSPFFLYFYFIPVWIFIFGVLLIWLTDRKIVSKILWTAIPILIFLCYQFIWHQINKVQPEAFLIPHSFRGKIHIRFNESCGKLPEYKEARRIYWIPNNGILLSQFVDKQGFIGQEYYLVNSSGAKSILPQLDVRDYNEEWTLEKNPNEPSRDSLGVFHAGRVFSDGTYEFYVLTYTQLKDSFDFQYDKHFDVLEQKIIDSCRNANRQQVKKPKQ